MGVGPVAPLPALQPTQGHAPLWSERLRHMGTEYQMCQVYSFPTTSAKKQDISKIYI